jgi:acyl-CoA hydrolase
VIHTGTSSMHLAIEVMASNLRKGEERLATSCVMVFVALDTPDGKPTPVPTWQPRDEEDRRLQARALRLVKLSREMQNEVLAPAPA